MTATLYPFVPSASGTPQFTPTFDGEQYTVSVTWGLFGQRYFIKCVDMNGNTIYMQPLTESNPGIPIQTLAWNSIQNIAQGSTSKPHGYAVGATIKLTISGAYPSQYNGTWLVLITGSAAFSYSPDFSVDPGAASIAGMIGYNIDMNEAYFDTPLVYVNGNFVVGQ